VKYQRFGVPIILLILTIVLNRIGYYLIMGGDLEREISPIVRFTSIMFQLCSIVLFFVTLVVFAYSLGKKSEKVENVENKEGGNWWSIERPEDKNTQENNGDKARIVGFSSIALSGFAILVMIILGIISIISSLGSGLGFSGGTCDSFCERTWIVAILSGKMSIYLFFIGLISLARPWSWIPKSWISEIFPNEEE
tara:strand:- start:3117 stop:3701 length:585 start_codon:yes stop_codon:yes gene_type:complete